MVSGGTLDCGGGRIIISKLNLKKNDKNSCKKYKQFEAHFKTYKSYNSLSYC